MDLIVARPKGLLYTEGDFYIDPWGPVGHAVITCPQSGHAHVGHSLCLAHPYSLNKGVKLFDGLETLAVLLPS